MKTLSDRAHASVATRFPSEVLLISEDPAFIQEVQERTAARGLRTIGCLGPAHTHCDLIDDRMDCPLTENAFIAIVDSPPSGVFRYHWKAEAAGTYAEKLARRHRDCFVILCGAPLSLAGPTGDVAHVSDRAAALQLLDWVAVSYGVTQGPAEIEEFSIREKEGSLR